MNSPKEDIINALKEAISLHQETLLNDLLLIAGIEEIDEKTYQKMLHKIKEEDPKLIKLLKSLETQEIIELVLTNKLDK
tara:strand:- start:289 stop:525 length:237 start_codon:yes stop_codon:yes gene_type:complete